MKRIFHDLKIFLTTLLSCAAFISCEAQESTKTEEMKEPKVKQLRLEVLKEIPRKHIGFTQGLFILDGKLYESTGLYGKSKIRRIDLKTQRLEAGKDLPKEIFAEGLAPLPNGKMAQLSWRSKVGLIYDRKSLNVEKAFKYNTEGWGLATKDEQVVMSDGSDVLQFLHPTSLKVINKIKVTKEGKSVKDINELEWVGHFIYANVWMKDEIIKIDPETGKVIASIDCSKIYPNRPKDPDAVLNGIAYDDDEEVFYITGKLWKNLYKVKFVE